MFKKPHLISTSAYFLDDQIREQQYIKSFEDIKKHQELFESITIIETISKVDVDYITKTEFNNYYSEMGNIHKNKGFNWVLHIENFLNNSIIGLDDVVIFITGRYRLLNGEFINIVNDYMYVKDYEMLAKEDGDIYNGNGVHTFLISFTKKKFLHFSKWYKKKGNKDTCVEWEMKKYMKKHSKCFILDKRILIGVETNVFNSNEKYIV
jgi:hypothetical protein